MHDKQLERLFILISVEWDQRFFFLFKNKRIVLIMLLQLSHFPPFIPLCPAHPLPPALPSPPLSSCPWVIHISSLALRFPYYS